MTLLNTSMTALPFPISPLQLIAEHPGLRRGISLYLKRDDLLNPLIQGSKARKLAAVIPLVQAAYPGGIATFGGAFSNHLHAVAAAGRIFDFPTIGVLRGEHLDLQNPTLRFCQENGMQLVPISKKQYDLDKKEGFESLKARFPSTYILPEGGNIPAAVEACKAISEEIMTQLPPAFREQPFYCCVPAGTGCTAAGVLGGIQGGQVVVFPVSSHDFGPETILNLLPEGAAMAPKLRLVHDYNLGGFAKFHSPVMAFVRAFHAATNILLDPVYTAKMLFGVFDMLAKGDFADNSTVVVLHTGGLQGWAGFEARYGAAGRP